MSDIDKVLESGDPKAILREWAKSERAASEGRFCQCETPDLTGRKSHLCFGCGLYNLKRKSEIETAMQQPHPYEIIERFRGGLWEGTCCDFCAWPKTHPLHQAARPAPDDAGGEEEDGKQGSAIEADRRRSRGD